MIRIFLWAVAALVLVSPPLDPFLDAAMARHVLLQIPALFFLGFIAGRSNWISVKRYNLLGLAGLVFFIGSLLFWMIPRSLDAAVSDNRIDQLMHLNIIAAGWALSKSLPLMPVIMRVALGMYGLTMIISLGAIYSSYDALICAVYSIGQQKETGWYLFRIAAALFLVLLVRGGYILKSGGEENRQGAEAPAGGGDNNHELN